MPVCPSCGNRLGRLEVFIIKNHSLYKCPNCDKISEVFLIPATFKALWFTQILSVITFVSAVFAGGVFPLIGLIVILLIFGGFYWILPKMIALDKPKYIKVKPAWYKRIIRKIKHKKRRKDEKIEQNTEVDIEQYKEAEVNENDAKEEDNRDIFSS